MSAALLISDSRGQRRFEFSSSFTIGRQDKCALALQTDSKVSKEHCAIHVNPNGEFAIEDLGSRNGTYLNGTLLKPRQPMPLRHNDTISVGETVLLLEIAGAKGLNADRSSIIRYHDRSEDVLYSQKAEPQLVDARSADIDQLRAAAQRLKLLVDIGQAISKASGLRELLDLCLNKLFEVFPQVNRGIVILYNPDGSLPNMQLSENEEPHAADHPRKGITAFKFRTPAHVNEIKLSRTIIQRVKEKRQSILFSLSNESSSQEGQPSLAGISSLMCAPLISGDTDQGFIQLETSSGVFQQQDLSVLTVLAAQVALLIRNSELSYQAAKDAVTRENLRRFLSPGLANRILSGQMNLELGGTERKGTIFYSDIVGFTRMGPQLSPRNIVTLLNRYFKVMQNIIFRCGGAVDKCAGDSIMAFWGVLDDDPEPTHRAALAAIEMQIAMFEFNRNEGLRKEIVLPPTPLGHGIGLNTGIVCAGNIGSEQKIEFTVIGDTVNVAARIEALAGRGQVFVGKQTFDEIKDRSFCFCLPECSAKNVANPLNLFAVRGIVPPVTTTAEMQTVGPLQLHDLLFALPCSIFSDGKRIAGVVTGLSASIDGSHVVLQLEEDIKAGAIITLEWNLPEKPTLRPVEGTVDRSVPLSSELLVPRKLTAIIGTPRTGRAVASNVLAPGMAVLSVRSLPTEFATWQPGMVFSSDLSHESQIIRA